MLRAHRKSGHMSFRDVYSRQDDRQVTGPSQPAVTHPHNTSESIALNLFYTISHIEKKALHSGDMPAGWTRADRRWVLRTYGQCIRAVRQPYWRRWFG